MSKICPHCHFDIPDEAKNCLECGALLSTPDTAAFSLTRTLAANPDDPAPGSLFAGRYKILSELGKGGMGVVYKAQDMRLKRPVALKFLASDLIRNEEAKQRLIREAQAVAALDHPHICTVHEIDESEGKTYISMAFVKGQTLKEKISAGPLGRKQSIRTALQIAEGVKAAHEKKIVHRDIKPANIMLTEKNQVRVMDFGIAKRDQSEDLTRPATRLGTIAYMSPEQAKGEKVDHRTDIWSFGVLFYEMLTGRSPFRGGHEQVTLHAILKEEPEPISDALSPDAQRTDEIIKRCLQKDPSNRYQDMDSLIRDLEPLAGEADNEGVLHQPATGTPTAKSRRRVIALSAVFAAFALVAVLASLLIFSGRKADPQNPRLVVLPFENLGPAEDEYFADGMTEEITSRLAKISSLGVISRTSAVLYAGSGKTIKQIREELDVDYVLEGTVRWALTPEGQGRVKITPQLIQTSNDTHVWTDTFDRVVDDIFDIQSDIARTVVEKLDLTLLEAEHAAVATRPTESVDAYQAFLRGRYLAGHPHYTRENWIQVIRSFEQAVELDPEFGQAYAELAKAHARFHYLRSDISEERLQRAHAAAHKALELAPDSPEVHLALSFYYLWALRDPGRSLEALKKAEESMPNNAEILLAQATRMEVLGRFEEGIEILQKALVLSPLDSSILTQLAGFYWLTRQYTPGIEAANQAIELNPEEAWPYFYKIFIEWGLGGATPESRAVVEAMPQDHDWAPWIWFWQEVGERNYPAALARLSSLTNEWIRLKTWARPVVMFKAFIYDNMNEKQKAREAFKKAKTMLEEEVSKQPNDPRLCSSLGIAYAALGDIEKACQQGKKAIDLLPYRGNPMYGVCYIQDLALTYLIAGNPDSAVEQIEFLLSIHSWITIPFLEMNPYWERIRDHPRFLSLIEQHK